MTHPTTPQPLPGEPPVGLRLTRLGSPYMATAVQMGARQARFAVCSACRSLRTGGSNIWIAPYGISFAAGRLIDGIHRRTQG